MCGIFVSTMRINEEEIQDILRSNGHIEIQCEFCLDQYQFNELDIKTFLAVAGNETKH